MSQLARPHFDPDAGFTPGTLARTRKSPQVGRIISAQTLAKQGFFNERGRPFTHKSVAVMEEAMRAQGSPPAAVGAPGWRKRAASFLPRTSGGRYEALRRRRGACVT